MVEMFNKSASVKKLCNRLKPIIGSKAEDVYRAYMAEDADGKKESVIAADKDKFVYKKLVLDNDRIAGAILLGDIADRQKVMKAIEDAIDISLIKEKLATWDLSSL